MATNLWIGGNLRQDWANNPYWSSSHAGDTTAYGGGQLMRNADGSATYSQAGQNPYTFSQSTDPATIAANSKGIADQWSSQYGNGAWGSAPQSAPQAPQATSSGSGASFGNNPWLQQQGQALQAMSNQNLRQNVLPGIGQGAQAAGMYGSSRQGIAEGQAIGNAQTGLNNALANMYSQSYGQDQQYDLGLRGANNQAQANANSLNLGMGQLALGNKQANNSYDLGLRSNQLGQDSLDWNINQGNFNNQLAGANFGLGIYDRMNGYNSQTIANGTQMQNTPMNYFNQANSNTNATGGMGGTTSGTVGTSSNPTMQGLGLMQYGAQNGGTLTSPWRWGGKIDL